MLAVALIMGEPATVVVVVVVVQVVVMVCMVAVVAADRSSKVINCASCLLLPIRINFLLGFNLLLHSKILFLTNESLLTVVAL